jgi:integrase
MTGSMQQRGRDSWRLRVYGGQGRYVAETVHGTRTDAKKRLARLAIEVEDGRRITAKAQTFEQLLDRWYATKEADLAPKSRELYRGVIDRHLVPALGLLPLARLHTRDLDGLYAQLRSRGLSATTVRKVHLIANAALQMAVRWGHLAVNPAAIAKPPSLPRSPVRAPGVDEMGTLLTEAAAGDPMFATLAFVAATTGARRGELAALRWTDIDLHAGTVRIARAIDAITTVEKPTKTGSVRVVPIGATTVAALREHHERCRETMAGAGGVLSHDAYLFSLDIDGAHPLRPDGISYRWRKLRERVGSDARFHGIRHFVGTQLIANGVDVQTTADLLGHANAVVTLAFYTHTVETTHRNAANVISTIVSRGT